VRPRSTRSSSVTCSHGLTGYAGTAGPSYVRDIYGVVRNSIGVAVKRGGLTADPCSAITLSKATKKPKVFLETTNLPAIAAELEQPWRDTIEFMLKTGLCPASSPGCIAPRQPHPARAHRRRGVRERKNMMRGWRKDSEARAAPLSQNAIEIAKRRIEGRDLNQGAGSSRTWVASAARTLSLRQRQ
jgi:hypothetical protein